MLLYACLTIIVLLYRSNFHVMAFLFKVCVSLKGRIKILEIAGERKSPELLQTGQD